MTLTEPATAAGQPGRATLASVRNAARVLRAFSRAGQELGVTELARQLGLSKSTVHRLVTTLTAERLLERGSTPGRYRLGLVLYELGKRLADWRPVAQTPWTITDKNRLLAELAAVAERGWAQNQEEGHRGIVSVGAPIRGRDGTVMAAVSVVGDSARMRAMMRRATTLVVESARVISRRLGYNA